MPDPEVFAATLGRLGIGAGDTVVAYDEGSGAIAARLWWLLGWLGHERRAVLDGGFAAWQEGGFADRGAGAGIRAATLRGTPAAARQRRRNERHR